MKKFTLLASMLFALAICLTSCKKENNEEILNNYLEYNGARCTIPSVNSGLFDYLYYLHHDEDRYHYFAMDFFPGGRYGSDFVLIFNISDDLMGEKVSLTTGGHIWSFLFYENIEHRGIGGNNESLDGGVGVIPEGISTGEMKITSLGGERFRIEFDVVSTAGSTVKGYFEGKMEIHPE